MECPGRPALRADQGQLLPEVPGGAGVPVGEQRAELVEDQQVQRRLPGHGDLAGAVSGEGPLGGLHVLHVLADQRPAVGVVVGVAVGDLPQFRELHLLRVADPQPHQPIPDQRSNTTQQRHDDRVLPGPGGHSPEDVLARDRQAPFPAELGLPDVEVLNSVSPT
jgi:hypothetical protein